LVVVKTGAAVAKTRGVGVKTSPKTIARRLGRLRVHRAVLVPVDALNNHLVGKK